MKKNLKTLMLGILIGALLVGTPALAGAVLERIDVYRNQITVMIGGQKLDADNFLYKDTTYVPIRKVAEGLGMNVTYKDGVAYIGDRYAAVFGGTKIDLAGGFESTTEELDAYIKRAEKNPGYVGYTKEQIEATAKAELLQYKAIEAVAAEHGISVDKEFYDNFSAIIDYMKRSYGGEDNMLAAMKEAGYTFELYKRFQETDYLYRKLIENPAFSASAEEVKAYYEANGAEYAYNGVQAQHILISTRDENNADITDAAKLKEIEKKVNSIYKEAKNGADFSALVEKYGEDPGMSANPEGYIFTTGEMVEEFEKAAFALKDGEISEPVKTDFGWHIIKRIKTHSVQPFTDALAANISQALAYDKVQDAINAKMAK